jgi:phosphate transport system substrate-binding protein
VTLQPDYNFNVRSRFAPSLLASLLMVALGACSTQSREPSGRLVKVDGSSTMFPLSEAILEEFHAAQPGIRVTVNISGTSGGFQKFCRGAIDIGAAARPIRRDEIEACHKAGVRFIELPIAFDGIAVVVHPNATWVDHLTVEELNTLWAPQADGVVKRWNQIRTDWPNREIHLFGAGPDSATYDHFTVAIVGREGVSRRDFTASEDDNALLQAVAADELALGFVPLAYYEENRHRLRAVPIDNEIAVDGDGPIAPSRDTIRAGTYQPLARPNFIYVRDQALDRPGVLEFVDFYLARAGALAHRMGYLQLGPEGYELAEERRKARWTGTSFGEGGSQVGLTVEQLLDKSRIP